MHPVEQAHVLEVAEPAELPGQREQERAHRPLGRSRLGRAELRGAGPDQPRPLPTGPGPVGPAGPRAVRQDQPGGVAAGAAQVGIVVVVQRRPRRVQRLDQPGEREPLLAVVMAPRPARVAAAQAGHTEPVQRVCLGLGQLAAPVVAADPGPSRPGRWRCARRALDGPQHAARPGSLDITPAAAASDCSVSMPTRHGVRSAPSRG